MRTPRKARSRKAKAQTPDSTLNQQAQRKSLTLEGLGEDSIFTGLFDSVH